MDNFSLQRAHKPKKPRPRFWLSHHLWHKQNSGFLQLRWLKQANYAITAITKSNTDQLYQQQW